MVCKIVRKLYAKLYANCNANCMSILFNRTFQALNITKETPVTLTLHKAGGAIGLIHKTIGVQILKIYGTNGALKNPMMAFEMEPWIFMVQQVLVAQQVQRLKSRLSQAR